jgi:hypothetical protein
VRSFCLDTKRTKKIKALPAGPKNGGRSVRRAVAVKKFAFNKLIINHLLHAFFLS